MKHENESIEAQKNSPSKWNYRYTYSYIIHQVKLFIHIHLKRFETSHGKFKTEHHKTPQVPQLTTFIARRRAFRPPRSTFVYRHCVNKRSFDFVVVVFALATIISAALSSSDVGTILSYFRRPAE